MVNRKCCICDAKHESLHKFPKNEHLSTQWKVACGFRVDDVVKTLHVCSNHFNSEDYVNPEAKAIGGVLRLKSSSVPSLSVGAEKNVSLYHISITVPILLTILNTACHESEISLSHSNFLLSMRMTIK
ncbi:hypothetical protein FQR65_LT15446 [Abscondita terminalis]|nr:hypothetical protein FQR65_LT15446 [Abscondita terminalis]